MDGAYSNPSAALVWRRRSGRLVSSPAASRGGGDIDGISGGPFVAIFVAAFFEWFGG